jgi:hypothetical protein
LDSHSLLSIVAWLLNRLLGAQPLVDVGGLSRKSRSKNFDFHNVAHSVMRDCRLASKQCLKCRVAISRRATEEEGYPTTATMRYERFLDVSQMQKQFPQDLGV